MGIQFPIDSYSQELQDKWREERRKKQMKGVFKPLVDPVALGARLYQQMLEMAMNADEQAMNLHEEFMLLIQGLKSGAVSVESLVPAENGNGFDIIIPEPLGEPIEVVKPTDNGARRKKKVVA